jgi:LysR family transcriptional regulator, glycine cleavage system transcriptional activator
MARSSVSPPTRARRPIGLAGLRGFEASARLLSFTLAAEELHLTQSSISRQIKTLEEQVGKPLFRRRTRQLELTPAGQRLYRIVHSSLADIDRTVADVRGVTQRKRITLTTFASFASLMLVPRLALFSEKHPNIDIRIDAVDEVRDLENDGIDVAIRYCPIDRAPRGAVKLLDEHLTPALSPKLLARIGPLDKPADLARATFIENHMPYDEYNSWERWFEHQGESMPRDPPTISLNFTYQAIEAAVSGQGVMLAPVIYIREHVERRELVCPFPVRMASPHGYYMIVNRISAGLPHVAAFSNWLTALLRPEEAPERKEEAA